MGATEPALFSDDLACDVRDAYRELLEDGVDDAEATHRVRQQFAESISDPDDGPVFWLALAFTQSKVGRLDSEIRDRAMGIIERGEGLDRWMEDPKLLAARKKALTKVRAQLAGPQPERRRLRPPRRHVTDLQPGDVLLYRFQDRVALLRVARIDDTRWSVSPILVALNFNGTAPPPPETMAQLQDRKDLTMPHGRKLPPWNSATFRPIVLKRIDYLEAGFVRLGALPARLGDEARTARTYLTWGQLAHELARYMSTAPEGPQTAH